MRKSFQGTGRCSLQNFEIRLESNTQKQLIVSFWSLVLSHSGHGIFNSFSCFVQELYFKASVCWGILVKGSTCPLIHPTNPRDRVTFVFHLLYHFQQMNKFP